MVLHTGIYLDRIYPLALGRPWYSGSALDCWSIGRWIKSTPGTWFITVFISVQVVPGQYKLVVQKCGLKHESLHLYPLTTTRFGMFLNTKIYSKRLYVRPDHDNIWTGVWSCDSHFLEAPITARIDWWDYSMALKSLVVCI